MIVAGLESCSRVSLVHRVTRGDCALGATAWAAVLLFWPPWARNRLKSGQNRPNAAIGAARRLPRRLFREADKRRDDPCRKEHALEMRIAKSRSIVSVALSCRLPASRKSRRGSPGTGLPPPPPRFAHFVLTPAGRLTDEIIGLALCLESDWSGSRRPRLGHGEVFTDSCRARLCTDRLAHDRAGRPRHLSSDDRTPADHFPRRSAAASDRAAPGPPRDRF